MRGQNSEMPRKTILTEIQNQQSLRQFYLSEILHLCILAKITKIRQELRHQMELIVRLPGPAFCLANVCRDDQGESFAGYYYGSK